MIFILRNITQKVNIGIISCYNFFLSSMIRKNQGENWSFFLARCTEKPSPNKTEPPMERQNQTQSPSLSIRPWFSISPPSGATIQTLRAFSWFSLTFLTVKHRLLLSEMDEELQKRNTDCVYFLASPLTCKKVREKQCGLFFFFFSVNLLASMSCLLRLLFFSFLRADDSACFCDYCSTTCRSAPTFEGSCTM